ncbi:MAG: hypothetical protein FWD48_02815 [Oscillospiraceae bacterium]|nr:hypothetical protein [Oscillospiraceae bacterium]
MFGLFKKKKKDVGRDFLDVPQEQVNDAPPSAFNTPFPIDENGYFLSEKDIKVIVKACVFFARNGDGYDDIVDMIPETGGKLRDKTDLSPDDITVISICLQAYNNEMCKLMSEHPESPVMFKLRNEKVYFLTIIEKLTNYLAA